MESVKKLNEEKQNKLLDSPKFWKYGKHKEKYNFIIEFFFLKEKGKARYFHG